MGLTGGKDTGWDVGILRGMGGRGLERGLDGGGIGNCDKEWLEMGSDLGI